MGGSSAGAGRGVAASVDVAVIGGGIIGCSAAWFLARGGATVALCEKGAVGCEQSSRNWGFVRVQSRDPAEIPAAMESLRIWRRLAEDTGEDLGFRQGGALYLADEPGDLAGYEKWTGIAREHGLDTRILSPGELARLAPELGGRWLGAMYTPSDGRAEPRLATAALARAAVRAGATVHERCAVRGLDMQAGRVAGVVTEHGRIAADAVLCAGGLWSKLLCGRHGVRLPQLEVKSSVLRTAPAAAVTESALWTRHLGLRRRDDGGYTVAHGSRIEADIIPDSFRFLRLFAGSFKAERRRLHLKLGRRFLECLRTPRRWPLDAPSPFERTRVLDPAPNRAILDEAMRNLGRLFPALADTPVVERWAGRIDATPDALPVISPVAGLPDLYLATGFSGHGFGIGPGAGRLAAQMVRGETPAVSLDAFRHERFFDGTPLRPAELV